jgi:hypothetical protein
MINRLNTAPGRPSRSIPVVEDTMVERKSELKRRRHRREKMFKLKSRLAAAKDGRERENILKKIRMLSPFWTEAKA